MKKYFILLLFLMVGFVSFAQEPTGVIKGWDDTSKSWIPLAVTASSTSDWANFDANLFPKTTGSAFGWCASLSKYLPLTVDASGALVTSGGSEWTASGSTQIYTEKSVGIGTSTPDPAYKCYIDGDSRITGDLRCDTYGKKGYFWYISSIYAKITGIMSEKYENRWGTKPLLSTDNVYGGDSTILDSTVNTIISADGNEAMRAVGSTGDVLIGTTVDDGVNKLQVSGSAYIADTLKLEPIAEPSNPTEGMIYQSSADHHLYVYDGTAWKQLDN